MTNVFSINYHCVDCGSQGLGFLHNTSVTLHYYFGIMLKLDNKNFNLCSFNSIPVGNLAQTGTSHLKLLSNWIVLRSAAQPQSSRCGPISSQAEGSGVFQQPPWQYQQVRTRKRGTEYQPKNIKRKRTHGWIKRISSQGGIEVLLRRMLKGRKSLSH